MQEQGKLLKRLGMLLNQGYSLGDSIHFLSIQLQTEHKRQLLAMSSERLKNGDRFSDVLKSLKFHPASVSFAYYGENNGELAYSLQTAGELLEKRASDIKNFKQLLAYPVFLIFTTMLIFVVVQSYLLPQFSQLYGAFDAEVNKIITFLLWISEHQKIITGIFLAAAIVLSAALSFILQNKSSLERQMFLCRLPILGKILKKWNTYYISFHTSQLIKNGLPMSDCLYFLMNDPEKQFLSEAVGIINSALLSGESLPSAVFKLPIWQEDFAAVINHGQLSGKLDFELYAYSQVCYEQFTESVQIYIKNFQHCLFGFVGVWIIFLYFSIMLPSFQMINSF